MHVYTWLLTLSPPQGTSVTCHIRTMLLQMNLRRHAVCLKVTPPAAKSIKPHSTDKRRVYLLPSDCVDAQSDLELHRTRMTFYLVPRRWNIWDIEEATPHCYNAAILDACI